MQDIIVIYGPTACGKTRLSLEQALARGGEIISVDSRQIYRGMDIGTGKISLEDRQGIPHFGFDLVDPDESYSAAIFARYAREKISEIASR